MEDDETPSNESLKCFQIHNDDLVALEAILPDLMWFRPDLHTARQKIKWRRVIEIINNVRWNYGPPLQCFRVDAGGDDPTTHGEDWKAK